MGTPSEPEKAEIAQFVVRKGRKGRAMRRPTDWWLRRNFLGPRFEIPWLEIALGAAALALLLLKLSAD